MKAPDADGDKTGDQERELIRAAGGVVLEDDDVDDEQTDQ